VLFEGTRNICLKTLMLKTIDGINKRRDGMILVFLIELDFESKFLKPQWFGVRTDVIVVPRGVRVFPRRPLRFSRGEEGLDNCQAFVAQIPNTLDCYLLSSRAY
jgi:hypothetical protein